MDELGGGIDGHTHSDEVLNCYLSLGVSRCNIYQQPLYLSLKHSIEGVTYQPMMPTYHKLLSVVHRLEEKPGEVEGVRQQPLSKQIIRLIIHRASILLFKSLDEVNRLSLRQ